MKCLKRVLGVDVRKGFIGGKCGSRRSLLNGLDQSIRTPWVHEEYTQHSRRGPEEKVCWKENGLNG